MNIPPRRTSVGDQDPAWPKTAPAQPIREAQRHRLHERTGGHEYNGDSLAGDRPRDATAGPRSRPTTTATLAPGSGCSIHEAKPAWQADTGCGMRAEADVSADADPLTGVAVYDTYQDSGWGVFGGTSASSPIIASVFADSGTPVANTYPSSYPYANASHLKRRDDRQERQLLAGLPVHSGCGLRRSDRSWHAGRSGRIHDRSARRRQAADYPEPTSWESCGAIGGTLYCAGGTTDAGTSAHTYAYDPGSDSWSPEADLPIGLWGSGYAAADGELLVSGGVTQDNAVITTRATRSIRPATRGRRCRTRTTRSTVAAAPAASTRSAATRVASSPRRRRAPRCCPDSSTVDRPRT